MRKGLVIVFGLLMICTALFAQSSMDTHIDTSKVKPPLKFLIISDGLVITQKQMAAINPASIWKVDVLKPQAAIPLYGNTAKNGVLLITTKVYVVNQYQKKLSLLCEEYKQYLYVKEHNDQMHPVAATYYINGNLVENEYQDGTNKLYNLKSKDIKAVVADHNLEGNNPPVKRYKIYITTKN